MAEKTKKVKLEDRCQKLRVILGNNFTPNKVILSILNGIKTDDDYFPGLKTLITERDLIKFKFSEHIPGYKKSDDDYDNRDEALKKYNSQISFSEELLIDILNLFDNIRINRFHDTDDHTNETRFIMHNGTTPEDLAIKSDHILYWISKNQDNSINIQDAVNIIVENTPYNEEHSNSRLHEQINEYSSYYKQILTPNTTELILGEKPLCLKSEFEANISRNNLLQIGVDLSKKAKVYSNKSDTFFVYPTSTSPSKQITVLFYSNINPEIAYLPEEFFEQQIKKKDQSALEYYNKIKSSK